MHFCLHAIIQSRVHGLAVESPVAILCHLTLRKVMMSHLNVSMVSPLAFCQLTSRKVTMSHLNVLHISMYVGIFYWRHLTHG